LILKSKKPSTIADPKSKRPTEISGYRTSETCMFNSNDEFVKRIDDKICKYVKIDSKFGEPLQGQHYSEGQYFKEHTDYFDPGTMTYSKHTENSGNRTRTFMIYLNEDVTGGETSFPKFDFTCKPEVGKALTWNNTIQATNGETILLPESLHVGNNVKSGSKMVITKYFREKYNNKKNETKLLHWIGRFGNRMFQYAFINQVAQQKHGNFEIPSFWEGSILFNTPSNCNVINDDTLRLCVNQTNKILDTVKYRKSALNEYNERTKSNVQFIDTRNIDEKIGDIAFDDINCMYIPKLLQIMKSNDVKTLYKFSEKVKNTDIYKMLEKKKGTYDVAHIRRGDIAHKSYIGAHSMISKQSYLKAFRKYGYDERNLIWISDEISLRTKSPLGLSSDYFNRGHNWTYPMGEDEKEGIIFDFLPDFLILYFARTIFRANSSFSFWGSFLSDAKVYSPVVKSKPKHLRNSYYEMDVDFEEGNHPAFMGSKEEGFDDIIFDD
tara:strand:- start:6208 stop:7689 length:1482 start_codon:yes stop_codon:yes gene_type:complete